MAIVPKPKTSIPAVVSPAAVEAFINGAPDGGGPGAEAVPAEPKRVRKGRKVQISHTIAEPLLNRVDALAAQLGQSRAAVINLAVAQVLDRGLKLEGGRVD